MKQRKLLGFIVVVLAGFCWAQDNQAEQIIVPLSNPGQPGKLILEQHLGSISVKGYEGTVVLIKAFLRRSGEGAFPSREAEGMKPIPAAAIQLDAQEVGNVVTVDAHTRSKSVDVDVLVPFRFSAKLGVRDDGDVVVQDLAGEVEVDNPYGHVRLARLSGSASVNTVDGDISAQFKNINPGVPLAFTSIHGKVDVTFPPDVGLTVRMKSDEGMVYSDFDIALEKRKSVSSPAGTTGGTRIALEEWTTGRIGRGGTDVLMRSFDGNVYIRKSRGSPPRP
jgi:hypothetical protein